MRRDAQQGFDPVLRKGSDPASSQSVSPGVRVIWSIAMAASTNEYLSLDNDIVSSANR